jgi:hypothetical protein
LPDDLLLKGGTVYDLNEGNNEFQVVANVTRHGSKRLTCRSSICGGAILDPEPEGLPL